MPRQTKSQLAKNLAPWRAHLDSFRAANPGMTLKESMQGASATYSSAAKTARQQAAANRKSYPGAVGQKRGVSLAEARKLFRQYYSGKSVRGMRTDLSRARKAGRVLSPCKTRKNKAGKSVCSPRAKGDRSYLYRRSNGPKYYDMKGLDEGSGKASRRKVRKDSGKKRGKRSAKKMRGGYYW
jgi:hypothetical protein